MPVLDNSLTHLLWRYIADAWAILAFGWALWRGGRFERIGSAIYACDWLLSFWLSLSPRVGPAPAIPIIDIIACLAFAGLAVWSRRVWVFLFAASLVNLVATHLIAYVGHMGKYAYITALGIWGGYVPLLIITVAMIGVERRRARPLTVPVA